MAIYSSDVTILNGLTVLAERDKIRDACRYGSQSVEHNPRNNTRIKKRRKAKRKGR